MSAKSFVATLAAVVLTSVLAAARAHETVLYSFGATQTDGIAPNGGVLFDALGNIYGTTSEGGDNCTNQGGCGTVYELSPSQDGWVETVLYNFCQDYPICSDGEQPYAGLVTDDAGNLYGTTAFGGVGFGTVFELSPPMTPGGFWTENVIWAFQGSKNGDGEAPLDGKLNRDGLGNFYGTTGSGGLHNKGVVFELSPNGNGGWIEAVLHSFSGVDGEGPAFGVAIDGSGNLYGTTEGGGTANDNCPEGCGLVYRLSLSNGRWMEKVLYKFNYQDGANPFTPITIDVAGNLYGTFRDGGRVGNCANITCGGVFQLVPNPNGGVTKHSFFFNGTNGSDPMAGVLVDSKTKTVVGTTWGGNNVYMIRGNKERVLYQFCALDCSTGSGPTGGLLTVHEGGLYGATAGGGANFNSGVVFRLTR